MQPRRAEAAYCILIEFDKLQHPLTTPKSRPTDSAQIPTGCMKNPDMSLMALVFTVDGRPDPCVLLAVGRSLSNESFWDRNVTAYSNEKSCVAKRTALLFEIER